jgi:superfamily I DNA/RNA helicase
MKHKLLHIILLFTISFSTFHAFAVDILDSEHNHVVEYVQDSDHLESDDSLCHIHHFFHISYIIPEKITLTKEQSTLQNPLYFEKNYSFESTQKLLKPPRT